MTWPGMAVWTGLTLVAAYAVAQSVTVRANARVWGRPLLTGEEFAARHFPPEQRVLAAQLRSLLAPYVPIHAGRIAPTDRLVDDLGLGARISRGMDAEEFFRAIQREFGIDLDEPDFYEMTTFRSTVELIARKLAARNVQ